MVVSAPRGTIWPLRPHTKAKHDLLGRYLDAWLPIMSKQNRGLVLVDAFAGPGVYTDGSPGSPIVMLKSFLEHTYRDKIIADLFYIFIEARQDRCKRLEAEIARLGQLPRNAKCKVVPGRYEEIWSEVVSQARGRGEQLYPTFLFLDPFGYKDVPMELTGEFLQFDKCEVLVYVPLRSIKRAIPQPKHAATLDRFFGTSAWRQTQGTRQLHDLFASKLRERCCYVRSFEIVARKATRYHLFFGTNHPRGLEKMKDAMWRVDPAGGSRFQDSTVEGQEVLFELKPDLTKLQDALRKRFPPGTKFSIKEAEDFTLFETPFLPRSHLRSGALKPLEESGELLVTSPRRRRGTYPEGTIMTFREQRGNSP